MVCFTIIKLRRILPINPDTISPPTSTYNITHALLRTYGIKCNHTLDCINFPDILHLFCIGIDAEDFVVACCEQEGLLVLAVGIESRQNMFVDVGVCSNFVIFVIGVSQSYQVSGVRLSEGVCRIMAQFISVLIKKLSLLCHRKDMISNKIKILKTNPNNSIFITFLSDQSDKLAHSSQQGTQSQTHTNKTLPK